jgi:hypothetical protein|tara:strand:- start:883 stop:2277 length:1395 start_codon:yes stop_codon:yes gene_type:complete
MVGEISPDGKFVWNGTEWVPKEEEIAIPEVTNEPTNNVFQLGDQELAGDVGWEPVSEKTNEGGKGKLIAMSIVGMLILSALGWVLYAFVIDPMLFPDPYSKTKFVSVVDDHPTAEDVISGDTGPWACFVEMEIEEEGMTIRTNFDIYASDNSARSYSKISLGFFGSYESDVWIDEGQIAWKIDDGETTSKNKVSISGLDTSPANEILHNSSSPVELCFLHHDIVKSMDENPSQKFTSDKERFPDEDGVRAVKVETKMELEDEEGDMNIAVYFDDDENILGTKISNSSFECLITYSSDSLSKPSWVSSANSGAPMLVDIGFDNIWSTEHNSMVHSQYNATYSMEGAKIVIYDTEYDDEGNSTNVIMHEVSIQDAMNDGALIQPTNWNNEPVNCTLSYSDSNSDGMISSGDIVSVDCEEDVLSGLYLGLADENGVAEQVSMDVPWLSPIFTIVALLGAAMLVSRRE